MSADVLTVDCIVVGSGHAGSCAALAARDAGCKRVLIVEKSPPEWVGGNGYFTAGAHRTVHGGLQDLLPIVQNVTPEAATNIDLAPYTADEFTRDIMRLGDGRSDPDVVKALVDGSRDAVQWLAERVHVPFIFAFHRQAYLVNGRQVFWGGLALSVQDGGKGMIAADRAALAAADVETWFNTAAVELVVNGDAVVGLQVSREGESITIRSPAVILACGGFEASRDLRSQYLGPEWQRAKVQLRDTHYRARCCPSDYCCNGIGTGNTLQHWGRSRTRPAHRRAVDGRLCWLPFHLLGRKCSR